MAYQRLISVTISIAVTVGSHSTVVQLPFSLCLIGMICNNTCTLFNLLHLSHLMLVMVVSHL